MGLTLQELQFIKINLMRTNRQADEIIEALQLIQREINLKEMDVRKSDYVECPNCNQTDKVKEIYQSKVYEFRYVCNRCNKGFN